MTERPEGVSSPAWSSKNMSLLQKDVLFVSQWSKQPTVTSNFHEDSGVLFLMGTGGKHQWFSFQCVAVSLSSLLADEII